LSARPKAGSLGPYVEPRPAFTVPAGPRPEAQAPLTVNPGALGEPRGCGASLNDTTKIVGMLVAAGALALPPGMALAAVFLLLGGLL
jgi:hypothetical protein